jgi:hypothetical protein
MKLRRYYLTISTYAGIVPGAFHVCGRIRTAGRHEIDLECRDPEGGKTIRFRKKDTLLAAARRWFKQNAERSAVMTIGSHCVLDPQQILCGRESIKAAANKLWRQFESYNGWSCTKEEEPAVKLICDAWDKIIPRDYDV